jgi:hypothetical protein
MSEKLLISKNKFFSNECICKKVTLEFYKINLILFESLNKIKFWWIVTSMQKTRVKKRKNDKKKKKS